MLTDLSFLELGASWPPPSEAARLERYADNRLLWSGDHPQIFNDWVKLLRQDEAAVLEFVINLPKRLSTLWADLLLGEPPRFQAGDDGSDEQQFVDRLVADTELAVTAYEVALDTSRFGDGLFRLRLADGRAVIEGQPPTLWFPVVSRDNVREVQAHVLAWTFDVTEGRGTTTYLRTEIHTRGQIERRVLRLASGRIVERVAPADVQLDIPDTEQTGIDDFLVVPVPGLRTTDAYHGADDYSDLISLLQELEVRLGQISRILDKHADPSMYGPGEAIEIHPITGESEFRGGGQYFRVEDGETPPGYVTWDGQLTAAFAELERLIHLFYVVSETSPAAFGQMDAGLAQSGTALRRLMMAPLAKVNRVRLRFDPRLRKLVRLAADLERANGGTPPELGDVSVQWRDGLPDDPMENATIESTRIGVGLTSRYSAIRRLDGGTDAEINDELQRIEEDEAEQAGSNPLLPALRLRFGGNDANGNAGGQGSGQGA